MDVTPAQHAPDQQGNRELESERWLTAVKESVDTYRSMIDDTIVQLSDSELHQRPRPDTNSVAVILRHIGGNLFSRWTDYLSTDGEKPDRARDTEFEDWDGGRESLMQHLDRGWNTLTSALEGMDESTLLEIITIRGEPHTIAQAVTRSITHLSYHVGQITIVARLVHTGEWNWLTIAPGHSEQHNQQNWGGR